MSGKLLTAKALAERLGVPRRTLYNWLKSGTFPIEPVPGLKPRKWNATHVDAWVNSK